MAAPVTREAWLNMARLGHNVNFRRMAIEGCRWHLCRGNLAGGALVLPEHECEGHEIIVRNVHAMTADTMICRAHDAMSR